jgi:Cu+-exporting ATPase
MVLFRSGSTSASTASMPSVDNQVAGALAIADPIKATTPDALKALRAEGIRVVMLSWRSASAA